ncbi:MAG: methyltransferase domain-containing protein [Alphaproteobacteria bacterium]|nr:methyltransferase domain-containing protein [Alphaproteobacteria bacterium]MDE2112784.1 methyltransferase domain-containing protein [Alphaproteobacteria bacterium]MDE2493297.1 methyltransferase domain-containing protein [Alphaproteobacteria bacterium]
MKGEPAKDHATLMDQVYRHQRYIYDFTRKYYLFGRDRLIRELALRPGDRVVEVGCGTARNLIRIAERYPQTRLFGVDASHEMLKTAAEAVRRAGLEAQIRLAHGYAEDLSPAMFGEHEAFDACLFSYSLSMIPQWKQALKQATTVLSPNGRIHVVDFGDLTGLGRAGRAVLLAWLGLFHVAPRAELLHALEHNASTSLRLLPGRYAFLLTGDKTLSF